MLLKNEGWPVVFFDNYFTDFGFLILHDMDMMKP